MSKFVRPAIIALALLGTISAASAAPQHQSGQDEYHHSTLDRNLDFWAQFNK